MSELNTNLPVQENEERPIAGGFVLKVVLLALVTLGVQVGAAISILSGPSARGFRRIPMVARPPGMVSGTSVLPGSAAVWKGEIWVSLSDGPPTFAGMRATRGPKASIVAIDMQTGQSRDTLITLSPAPIGLIVVNDQLWAVSDASVTLIQNAGVIERRPRRSLNQPMNLFIYQDQLAVIDKSKDDVYSLLKLVEGEWVEVGKVDVPPAYAVSRWIISELRVVSDGKSIFLFFADGQRVLYREGIEFIPDDRPISALQPANEDLADLRMAAAATMALPENWKQTPITNSWNVSWDVVNINGELCAVQVGQATGATSVSQFVLRGNSWTPVARPFPANITGFSLIGGPNGYLVDDDLRLYSFDIAKGVVRIATSSQMTDEARIVLVVFELLISYLVTTGLLVAGVHVLIKKYRSAGYLYGKRLVTQASLGRRAVARGIDVLITNFPAAFWFIQAVGDAPEIDRKFQLMLGLSTALVMVFFSIFGMWLVTILVFSLMEGVLGVTPGKWICGIRALRTTLRPCGPLRAFTRELMVYADSLALLLWLPGVLMIAFTKNWQRMGDLVADTVVVVAPKRHDTPK